MIKQISALRHNRFHLSLPMVMMTVVILFLSGCGKTVELTPPKIVKPTGKRPEKKPAPPPTDYYSLPDSSRPRPYKVLGKWYRPLAHSQGFCQQGIASWYGKDFHGKPTATGEPYDMYAISAAHKILPLGTWVRVTNLKNGKTIELRVNDRGPFVAGRIIDLSFGAAKELRIIGAGTAPVEVVALGKLAALPPTSSGGKSRSTPKASPSLKSEKRKFTPVDINNGRFFIQVGAFGERVNAEKLAKTLMRDYGKASVQPTASHNGQRTLYRVLVGHCDTLTQAQNYEKILRKKGFADAFTIAE